VGWLRPFQQTFDPELSHLCAFGRNRDLVGSIDDNDMGMSVKIQDDGNLESEKDWIENTPMELAEGYQFSY
jgi:hypothetical protein